MSSRGAKRRGIYSAFIVGRPRGTESRSLADARDDNRAARGDTSRGCFGWLCRTVYTAREFGIIPFVARDREVHVGAILTAFVVLAGWEDRILRTPVLTHEAAHVAQTMRRAP